MGKLLKNCGSGCVLFSCLGLLGAMWGATVEKDTSMFLPVFLFALFGVGLHAVGVLIERKNNPSSSKIKNKDQIVTGLLLFAQGILGLIAFLSNFALMANLINLNINISNLVLAVVSTLLFFLARSLRERLLSQSVVSE